MQFAFLRRLALLAVPAALLAARPLSADIPFITNNGFEADTYVNFPGYAAGNGDVITGWTISPTTLTGLNPGGGNPFANNGTVPGGVNVAFLQSGGFPVSLANTVANLVPGELYTMTVRTNSRAGYAVPTGSLVIDGGAPFTFQVPSVAAEGNFNRPYRTIFRTFAATLPMATFSLSATSAGDGALLFDDALVTPSRRWNLPGDGNWNPTTAAWYRSPANPLAMWANNSELASFEGPRTSGVTNVTMSQSAAAGVAFRNLHSGQFVVGGPGTLLLFSLGTETIAVDDRPGDVTKFQQVIQNPITFGSNLIVANQAPAGANSLLLGGVITRSVAGGSIHFAGTGNTTASGGIDASVSGGIFKSGRGTLTLNLGATTANGGLFVDEGVLSVASNFGANAVEIAPGSGLRLGSLTVSQPITARGTASSTSRIELASDQLTLGAGALVGASTASLSLVGFDGGLPALVTVNAANTGYLGALNLGTSGGLEFFDAPASAAGLRLILSGGGSIAANRLVLQGGSTLTIQREPGDALAGSSPRLPNAVVALHNSTFVVNPLNLTGQVTAQAETFAALELRGASRLAHTSTTGPAAGTQVNFTGGVTRLDAATLHLVPVVGTTGSSGINYNLGVAASTGTGTAITVVPWAASGVTGQTTNLVASTATGLRPLGTGEAQPVGGTASLSPARNNRLISSLAFSGAISVQSLLHATGTPSITGSGTINVSQAVLQTAGGMTFNGPAISFPNGTQGYVHLGGDMTFTGTSALRGGAGVAVSGYHRKLGLRPQLNFTNAGANNFRGPLTINGLAIVTFSSNDHLGRDAGTLYAGSIVLGGGILYFTSASAATVTLADGATPRPITVTEAGGSIAVGTAGSTLVLPGPITGPGQLRLGGFISDVTISFGNAPANTFSGGLELLSGMTLRVADAGQLGAGTISLLGGTIAAEANLNFTTTPSLGSDVAFDTQGFTITLAGGVRTSASFAQKITKVGSGTLALGATSGLNVDYLVNEGTLRLDAGFIHGSIANNAAVIFQTPGDLTYSGAISGPGAFTQNGPGILTLVGAQPSTGVLQAQAGRILLPGSWAGGYAVSATGRLSLAGGSIGASGQSSTIAIGGRVDGTGTLRGDLANSGQIIASGTGQNLTINGGAVTNAADGRIRATQGAVIDLSGAASFVNNGLIDRISGAVLLPPNFVNNGILLEASDVRVKSVARTGTTITVTIDSYTGHNYVLRRINDLVTGDFTDVTASQPGATGTTLTFTTTDAGAKGFYRIVLD